MGKQITQLTNLGNHQIQDILEELGMLDDNGYCPHTAEEIFKAGMRYAHKNHMEKENVTKVIRKSFEREVTCPRCQALLYYVTKDVHLVGDMEGNYDYCVKCPECGKEIKVI